MFFEKIHKLTEHFIRSYFSGVTCLFFFRYISRRRFSSSTHEGLIGQSRRSFWGRAFENFAQKEIISKAFAKFLFDLLDFIGKVLVSFGYTKGMSICDFSLFLYFPFVIPPIFLKLFCEREKQGVNGLELVFIKFSDNGDTFIHNVCDEVVAFKMPIEVGHGKTVRIHYVLDSLG